MGGSEKIRGTVITSLQLMFRRRDRNYEKHARHTQGIFGDSQSGKKTGNSWGFLGFWL